MRLAGRLVLNTFVVATLLMALVLFTVNWRVSERVRAGGDGVSEQEADLFLRQVRRDILFAGLGTLVVGVLFARALARPLARPIEELSDVARALAAGDLTRRPMLSGPGEVGDLDDALRRLAAQLEARLRALQAEESPLVAITESINEGVIAVDRHGRVVRVNAVARGLLALQDPVPFPVHRLPADRTLRGALEAALQGRDADPADVTVEERTISLTARPLPEGGAVLALYDLSPFRKLEAVRRDFVANVSHELRTPLTIISGFVETLHDEDVPPPLRRQFLGMVSGNVMRMGRIVDDLLDLSRIESGGWVPNPTEQDMPALANEILGPLRTRADERGVRLGTDIASDATRLYADYTAARQILTNLAENALRYTSEGSVVLFARAESGGVWIGVRDTGVGISADHLPRLFERFYRVDPGRSREAGGTGLGLAIVRHLTEAHGGRVHAESTLGEGTSISAWFPGA